MIYLRNKDLLKEIKKSKDSYSSYSTKEDADYDIIVNDISDITPQVIEDGKEARAIRLAKLAHEEACNTIKPKPKLGDFQIDPSTINRTDIVFRVMTYSHIPKEPGRVNKPKREADHHAKVPFPPYKHYRFTEEGKLVCVGKSHWKGDLEEGKFDPENGMTTRLLAEMYMKLCQRYASRGNWRNYCVDAETEALTKRGWLKFNEINTSDIIMSYTDGHLKWSKVKSVFMTMHDGNLFKLTNRSIDSLITENHKILTKEGLKPIELLKRSDQVIVMGKHELDAPSQTYLDEEVELFGWIATEGCFDRDTSTGYLRSIGISQNMGKNADSIRRCLDVLQLDYTERQNNKLINFRIKRKDALVLEQRFPSKDMSMEFILKLTPSQRELLINTLIKGDGWDRTTSNSYYQKSKQHVDNFQALCALQGIKSNAIFKVAESFGKPIEGYVVNLFTERCHTTRGECIDLHGGWNSDKSKIGQGKHTHPNIPTEYYKGVVWCPETEYGCFLARRNGKVYLTGNSYNDEMQGQAIIQLVQVGLQFDESKSENPFSYYTSVITNSFTKILNNEKKQQNIRDDILVMNDKTPSYTRQNQTSD